MHLFRVLQAPDPYAWVFGGEKMKMDGSQTETLPSLFLMHATSHLSEPHEEVLLGRRKNTGREQSSTSAQVEEVKLAVGEPVVESAGGRQPLPDFYNLPLKEARERFEKAYLEFHLDKYAGSVARLSAAIGLERTHLYRKLNSLGIRFREKR